MMGTYSLIDATGLVVNVLAIGPLGLPEDWPVPEGFTLIREEGGQIGGRWTGAVFEPPAPPEPGAPRVPQFITNFQMRAILRREGHFATINALVQGSENDELIDAFEYANHVYRSGLAVASIKAALDWSDAYLDQLFIAAAEIEA